MRRVRRTAGHPPTGPSGDDYANILTAMVRLISSSCDVVGTVTTGTQLLDAARRLDPDVIVVDLNLPDIAASTPAGSSKPRRRTAASSFLQPPTTPRSGRARSNRVRRPSSRSFEPATSSCRRSKRRSPVTRAATDSGTPLAPSSRQRGADPSCCSKLRRRPQPARRRVAVDRRRNAFGRVSEGCPRPLIPSVRSKSVSGCRMNGGSSSARRLL